MTTKRRLLIALLFLVPLAIPAVRHARAWKVPRQEEIDRRTSAQLAVTLASAPTFESVDTTDLGREAKYVMTLAVVGRGYVDYLHASRTAGIAPIVAAARVTHDGQDVATCFGAQHELASSSEPTLMEIRCYGTEDAFLALPPNARVDVSWSVEMLVHGDRLVATRTLEGEARGVLLGRRAAVLL